MSCSAGSASPIRCAYHDRPSHTIRSSSAGASRPESLLSALSSTSAAPPMVCVNIVVMKRHDTAQPRHPFRIEVEAGKPQGDIDRLRLEIEVEMRLSGPQPRLLCERKRPRAFRSIECCDAIDQGGEQLRGSGGAEILRGKKER